MIEDDDDPFDWPRSELYEQSGGDVTRCELCGEPLSEDRPWRRGLDGAGAHDECLHRAGL